MKKRIFCLLFALLLLVMPLMSASAANSDYNYNLPYYSYTYDSTGNVVLTPTPYSVSTVIDGQSLGLSSLAAPTDLFYYPDNQLIYLTDSGNSRILVINTEYQLVHVIDSFQNEGAADTFNLPTATYVKNGKIYIADTENSRIICLDAETYELVKVYGRPEIKLLGENYEYYPLKVGVDLAGRLYVIARNINQGLLLLDQEGNFAKFAGAPDVVASVLDRIWQIFMTDVQKEQLQKAVPTEYNSIHIDDDGFMYLTTQTTEVHPITKLNSQGDDVLNYIGENYPQGDSGYGIYPKVESIFADVAVRDDGIYAAIDTKKSRVFVYDQEGSLLYTFGGSGSQEGTFYAPSAIEMYGDIILVCDRFYNKVTVFKQNAFGTCVDQAVTYMIDGDYENANRCWKEILTLCPSYDAAYIYLARVDIQNKDYDAALAKLKGTGKMDYYSKAFKGVREDLIRNNFTLIFIGIIVLVILIIAVRLLLKKFRVSERLNKRPFYREFHYSNYVMFHPFDGFWDIKREKRGSFRAANLLLVLFILMYALRAQYTAYMFSGKLSSEINVVKDVIQILIPIFLWIVSNWCFTTLMEGEGTMKDIYIATMYALKPYIITAIPLLLLSHCLSTDEAFIYTSLSTIVTIWMLALMFFGMMITHDYSLSKGILTAILSIVGILLIIFLALVFANVIQDIYQLVSDMIKEVSYRTY